MNLDEQLKKYKENKEVQPREEKIQETIETSKERFLLAEAEKTLSYRSFLYTQFRLIKKRWWLFQILILVALWAVFPLADDALYAYRSMGVAAALFIILIIPELWKNKTNQCMEIESATYYSLRQVYSARMLLFGIVDVFIITVFCGAASISLKLSLTDLLIQFLFPLVVTACICFAIYAISGHLTKRLLSGCVFYGAHFGGLFCWTNESILLSKFLYGLPFLVLH